MSNSQLEPVDYGSNTQRRIPPVPRGSLRELVRDPLKYFSTITHELGDIVCYRPAPDTAYLLNHPDFVRQVLVDNQRNYSKDTHSHHIFKRLMGDGLITAEGEVWRKQRRMMQPAFHQPRIAQLDGIVVEAAREMLEAWEGRYAQGQAVDAAREMAALTLAVTTRAFFGVNMGDYVKEIGETVNRVATRFEKPNDPEVIQARDDFEAAVMQIISQRRQDFQDKGDLLSAMMLSRDEESGLAMSDEQLRNQLMGLLLAGYETTANALTWAWYLLSRNPWAAERMRSQVRDVLGEREATFADLGQLPYVRQVFDESLRLFPPAWMVGRRAIGEDEIGGYYVAPGTVIAVSIYTLHRHPAFWETPDAFDPQNFAPETVAKRHKFAFIPFGAGPRQCIGSAFGTMEACLILACVAQRFELRLLPGVEVKAQPLFVLRPSRDVLMSLHK